MQNAIGVDGIAKIAHQAVMDHHATADHAAVEAQSNATVLVLEEILHLAIMINPATVVLVAVEVL